MGDVIAHNTVAPRGRQHEQTGFVRQRHGHAIDFELQHPFKRLSGMALGFLDLPFLVEQLFHTATPRPEIFHAVCVVDREHWNAMRDRMQFRHRLITDSLRGAIKRDELGMLCLEVLKVLDERVIFSIADLRRRLYIVETVMATDLPP